MIDIAALKNCKNKSESYGEICVCCNKCGRFSSIGIDTESCINNEERTDFQELTIVKDDTVTNSAVYIGGLCNLTNYTDHLKWISEPCEPLYMDIEYLTLAQIHNQIKKMTNDERVMITVIVNGPLHGDIYQCGNHKDGVWEKIGKTLGYA